MAVDRFEVIPERFAADRDPVLDDERRFGRQEGVSLDRVRGVGEIEIMDVLEIGQAAAELRAQPVEFGFVGDTGRAIRP